MNNEREIGGYRTVIQFDPEAGVFLEMCAEKGIDPVKHYLGRFVVCLPDNAHVHASEIVTACRVGP